MPKNQNRWPNHKVLIERKLFGTNDNEVFYTSQ